MRLTALFSVLLAADSIYAGPYTFRDVEVCSSCPSEAVFGITNSGRIAGLVVGNNGPRAFFGTDDAYTIFGVPGSPFTEAVDLDDSGMVTGDYVDPSGNLRVFVREPDGNIMTLPLVPGSEAMNGGKFNANGQLIGNYAVDNAASTGASAFVMQGLALDFTFSVPGAFITQALGINDAGAIVGFGIPPGFGPPRSFIRSPDGTLAPFAIPGAVGTSLFDINNRGDLAGSYLDATGIEHGFISRNGVLTTLDFTGPNTTVWGINDLGQAVGASYPVGGFFTGPYDGFVATPVPEPGSLALVALAMLLYGARQIVFH